MHSVARHIPIGMASSVRETVVKQNDRCVTKGHSEYKFLDVIGITRRCLIEVMREKIGDPDILIIRFERMNNRRKKRVCLIVLGVGG